MKKEIIEWCPKCGMEVKIGINGGKCSCGNFDWFEIDDNNLEI